jgi:glycosyltransferase involved in cell wall biosynthesis
VKIAVDGTEGFLGTLTGTGVYVRGLLRELLPLATEFEISVLGIRGLVAEAGHVPEGSRVLLRSPHHRSIWSQVRLPLHLVRGRYDLLHMPDHKLPRGAACATVITVHDLAFMRFPDTFTPAHLRRLLWFTRDSVMRATHVVAVSDATKTDLCEMLDVAPGKVTVIHHGVDARQFHRARRLPPDRPPYILSVGALQPRKNYLLLIRAFKALCGLLRDRIDLLIVGQRGWLWEPIEREAAEGPYAERIHLKGYVPDQELQDLYASATLAAFPSLYEGFGIPLLEAMASGVPVIASNASAFPEVIGDAGILLDPGDEAAWTETMRGVIRGDIDAERLRAKGIARAGDFTWRCAAEKTLEVYRNVVAARGTP